ncbi:hypothetical protein L1987_03510, partial [Smallanthus sonchifolius]
DMTHRKSHPNMVSCPHWRRRKLHRILHDMARCRQLHPGTTRMAHVSVHVHRRQRSELREHRCSRHHSSIQL